MAENQVQKLSIRHEAIMTWLLLNPAKSRAECAEHFGVTMAWLSVVTNSDVFRARLAELRMTIDGETAKVVHAKIHGVIDKGLERLDRMVEVSSDPGFVLNTTDKLLGRLGYGAKAQAGVVLNVQNNTLMCSPDVLAAARQRISDRGREIALELRTEASPPELLDVPREEGEPE